MVVSYKQKKMHNFSLKQKKGLKAAMGKSKIHCFLKKNGNLQRDEAVYTHPS